MKSKVRRSPQRSCLATRSWARFSPASVIPASARTPSSSSGTYFTAARISTSCRSRPARPQAAAISARTALEVRPHAGGVEAVDQLRHATPPWRPACAPSRRGDQSSPSGAQIVQSRCRGSRTRPRPAGWRARRRRGRRGRRRAARTERREGRVDLVPRLVAADAARRARSPRGRRSRPEARSARTASARTPAARPRQPACTAATASGATRTTAGSRRRARRRRLHRRRLRVGLRRRTVQVAWPPTTRTAAPCTCRPCGTRSAARRSSRRRRDRRLPASRSIRGPRRRQPGREQCVPPGRIRGDLPLTPAERRGERGERDVDRARSVRSRRRARPRARGPANGGTVEPRIERRAAGAPHSGPCGTPAASKSSPLIAGCTWRRSSIQARAFAPPAKATASMGAPRAARVIVLGVGGAPARP